MNEGMIEEFYKNYTTVNKYNVLIGKNNKQVVEEILKGFNASMEKIKKEVKHDMNLSFIVLKKYIEEYSSDNSQVENSDRMVP